MHDVYPTSSIGKRALAAFVAAMCAFLPFGGSSMAFAADTVVRDIEFPVAGTVSYHDDFGEPRSGHLHEATDIIGKKMMPLVSAVDGYVRSINDPEASWGYAITLEDADGYTYHYLHMNNDTPGTDDGAGGIANAYAPGIERGATVRRGQLVGWMGDSGNAENVGSHLHFEIRLDRTAINPYASLQAATRSGAFDPAAATAASVDIDTDKSLVGVADPDCPAGSRIKTAASTTVYYCGVDGKRYVFPNDKVYFSWFKDFTGVTVVTPEEMAEARLGGNVTYRPGTRMVKIQTDPKVYAVDRRGTLRWVASAEIAEDLYGASWAKMVDDVSDAYFVNYTVGDPIIRGN